jgi:hypothetical protein
MQDQGDGEQNADHLGSNKRKLFTRGERGSLNCLLPKVRPLDRSSLLRVLSRKDTARANYKFTPIMDRGLPSLEIDCYSKETD